jgi:hypothetical protein
MADIKFFGEGPILEEGISAVTATPSVPIGARRIHLGEAKSMCIATMPAAEQPLRAW